MERFLLARLHLDSLATKTDLRKFKNGLNSLPEGLDETYDELMSRVLAQHPDHVALARKVLYWVYYAARPMTVKEIQHALAIEPGDTSFQEDSIVDEELLVSVCTGIITVQKESGVIGLVHYTAQQYFERTAERYFPEARHEIVRTCLDYLSLDEFDKGPCRAKKELDARLDSWPLLRYVAQYWAEHTSLKKPPRQSTTSMTNRSAGFLSHQADDLPRRQDQKFSVTRVVPLSSEQIDNPPSPDWQAPLHSGISKRLGNEVGRSPGDLLNPESSNLESITRFLSQGAKVASFLEVAALRTDFRAPDVLIHLRTFPPTLSALSVCAIFNLKITAQNILYTGADVSIRDSYRRTPLHYAALYGHEAMALLLLEFRADVAAQDVWNATPLHQAVIRGHEAVVRILLDKGADVAAADADGYTPLHHAVVLDSHAVTKALIDCGADVNVESPDKVTPLHLSIGNSPEAVTRLLLDMGADVNAKDGHGKTPLHLTVIRGSQLAPLLLEHGADLSMKDDDGTTILHLAARHGWTSLAILFLKIGAEIGSTDNQGRTPLHSASQFGHKEVTESLLKAGASIIVKDNQGMTALHYAASFEEEGVIQLLLDYGANISSRDREGRSAVDVTAYMCNKSATQILMQNGADIINTNSPWGSLLQAAAQKGDVEMTRLFLEFGADINASGGILSQGRTALHLACSAGSVDCIEVLLECKANTRSLDLQKRTCLHHAASSGSAQTINLLLKEGLDPRTVDINGWTALDWAARGGGRKNFKILLEAVATEVDLWKPRNIAMYHGQMSLLSYLETLGQKSVAEGVQCFPIRDLPDESPIECNQSQDFPHSEAEFDPVWTELATLNRQSQAMPAPLHPGVWCDGCDLPIRGPRYKCTTCADFDYCFKCITSSKSSHPFHPFNLSAVKEATAFNVQLSLRVQPNRKEQRIPLLDWLNSRKRRKRQTLIHLLEVD